jgi:hypothetical protein
MVSKQRLLVEIILPEVESQTITMKKCKRSKESLDHSIMKYKELLVRMELRERREH